MHEARIPEDSWPTDFDDVRVHFKTELNTAATKKFKTKLLRASAHNSVAVDFGYRSGVLRIGVVLLQKAVGVDRVYECRDGVYLQVSSLSAQQLYGLEVTGGRGQTCLVGPHCIEQDRSKEKFHVMIELEHLKQDG